MTHEEHDHLLAAVGAHVRESRDDDRTFERLAEGSLEAHELTALERRAASDPELAKRLEASRPVTGLADRIAQALPPPAGPTHAAPAPAPPKSADRSPIASRPASSRLVALARRTLPYAAAAALAFAWLRRGGGAHEFALPEYTLTASADRDVRGEPTETATPPGRLRVRAAAGGRFTILIRPESAVRNANVVVYAFSLEGGELLPLEARVERSGDGAAKITGDTHALEAAREVRLVVTTAEALDGYEGALARARSQTSDATARTFVLPIDRDGAR
jgi:hypothetical protein